MHNLIPFPTFLDAVRDTAHKLLAARGIRPEHLTVTPDGGATASVELDLSNGTARIHLPSLPLDTLLTRGQADELLGFLVHELLSTSYTPPNTCGNRP